MVERKTVWAMYFSPTGGTKTAVKTIAKALAEKLGVAVAECDFTLPAAREQDAVFAQEDIVVCGTPVIAGRVPNVLLPYLTEKIKGNGALAVPVVSFGNRNFDDALIELRDILETNGLQTVAGGAFVSEHSFSKTLAAGRPDAEDIKKMVCFGEKIAEKLLSGWQYDAPIAVRGNTPIHPYFKPQDRNGEFIDIRKVKPKVNEHCCDCGICATVCPMGSIRPENVREYIGICIKCCACVKKCPSQARYYDDPGYLYHKEELEEMYQKRSEPEWFV